VILTETNTFFVDESWLKPEATISANSREVLSVLAQQEMKRSKLHLRKPPAASPDPLERRRNFAFPGRLSSQKSAALACDGKVVMSYRAK
jgi:hypothetical protein